MPRIKEITRALEAFAPLPLQESYDNCGLQIGDQNTDVSGILLCIDVVEATIDEAIHKNCNLIISHHPLIFSGLKSITGKNYIERTILKAIKHNIALYAAHTNFDAASGGVNKVICEKLGLKNLKILSPAKESLLKLVVYVPVKEAEKVRNVIFEAGAGVIGDYDCCSFNVQGSGTFRGGEKSNPFVGEKGHLHTEPEVRIETIMPAYISGRVVAQMQLAHPYEEVAYDLYPLKNALETTGAGMIGDYEGGLDEESFLKKVKKTFIAEGIRHTPLLGKLPQKIAVCGGSGSFLISNAIAAKADFFITGDIKYHDFFKAEEKIVLADIGHYESEQFTVEVFHDIILKNFSKFAVHYSEVNSNPLKYM